MAVAIMVSMVAFLDVPGPAEHARVDVAGAALSACGLAATVYALIESQQHGWGDPLVTASLMVGAWCRCACSRTATSPAPIWPPRSATVPSVSG
jgi:hypothetical protein